MHLPAAPSLVFLGYVLAFLPWVAVRSAHRHADSDQAPRPSHEAIWLSTGLSQIVLLVLAWLVGHRFGYEIFANFRVQPKQIGAALLAIATCFGLRAISQALRSSDERRKLAVYTWAPRFPREWALWCVTVLIASVAEEAAYRGVASSILWYTLGDWTLATLLSAVAFSVAHSTQGWKSAVLIFGVALVLHGLVAYTGTLIFAMAVHASYDLIAGYSISRTARQYDSAPAVAA